MAKNKMGTIFLFSFAIYRDLILVQVMTKRELSLADVTSTESATQDNTVTECTVSSVDLKEIIAT